jgi:antibiotic biosynthesis monooxygenase (ABM) superfamily enzyme
VKKSSGVVCEWIKEGRRNELCQCFIKEGKRSTPVENALLTWIAVWPTSMFISLILKPTLARNSPHVLAAGVVAGGIVVILYWIAMPLLVRVTRRWLYSEKKA